MKVLESLDNDVFLFKISDFQILPFITGVQKHQKPKKKMCLQMSLPGPFSLEIMVVHACIPLNIWKCWCYHTSLKNNGWNPKMKVWKMISLFKQVIFGFHVNFPGCISLTHLKKTFCQDSPKIHAFFGRVLIAMKNCHQDQPPLTYHQPCKQASKTAKVSYQDNSTQLTSPYSSFRCSSISACCDLAAKY